MKNNKFSCFVVVIVLLCHPFSSYSQTGVWEGKWSNPQGYKYDLTMSVKQYSTGAVKGYTQWTLRKSPRRSDRTKIGKSATAFFKGTYNKEKRELYIRAYSNQDPYRVIGYGEYRLKLSKSEKKITGISRTVGNRYWNGSFKSKYKSTLPSDFEKRFPKPKPVTVKRNPSGFNFLEKLLLIGGGIIAINELSKVQLNFNTISECIASYNVMEQFQNKAAGAIFIEIVKSATENRSFDSKSAFVDFVTNKTSQELKKAGYSDLAQSVDIASFLACIVSGD